MEAGAAVAPGRVVGIDLSSAMLDNGRTRAAATGRSNVSFVHGDAQVHAFEPASFDVVVSNAGAMFFDDQNAAFTNLRAALKPGGRIVLLVWQVLENNEWLTELRRALALGRDLPAPPVGTPGPFGLADPDQTRDLLVRTGYSSISIEDVRPPMRVGHDVESAYAFLSRVGNTRGLLDDLGADDRITALNNLRSVLAEHATPQGVILGTASWLVTATN
jgi:SAM-dependent methyltransferase